jgi:hypothetical protein
MSAAYTCDKCNEPISGPRSTLKSKGPLKASHAEVDLCGACSEALARWLDGTPTPAVADGRRKAPSAPKPAPA